MKPQPRLNLESFESRDVPAALFSSTWANAGALTLSFAPDATLIAGYSQDVLGTGQPSRLFAEMGGAGTAAQWQKEVLRAFQAWAAETNINIGLVADGGSPFGAHAAAGQVRVGALAAGADVVAINQAANLLGGAWAGALLFNTEKDFSVGARAGRFDIFSATLNEAGNIFGLTDSADVASALYGHYAGVRTGLTAADAAAIRTLYGTRTADAFETASAYRLNPYAAPTDATKTMVSAPAADLTTLADVDEYVFKTGAGTTSLTVRLETVGKSLLAAKVSVFTAAGALVGTASSTGPLATQDLVLTVTGVAADTDYRVKVEKVTDDVFGVGRYDLAVGYNFNPVGTGTATSEPTHVSDAETNEATGTATVVPAVTGSGNGRYVYGGRIETAADADVYRVTAPAAVNAPLTVTVDPRTAAGLYARVTVYAANGSVVPHDVLASGADGRVVVQVANPAAGQNYFVKVQSVGRSGAGLTGDYTVAADFTRAAVSLGTVASGTLTAATSTAFRTFSVPEAKLMHFALGAATTSSVGCGVRLIVYNAAGQIVATLTTNAGDTSTGVVFLNTGTYYLKFEAGAASGQVLPSLSYSLRAAVLSDPVDPYMPEDPNEPPPPPPDYEVREDTRPTYDDLPPDPWANPWQP
jgi:hypothetical protein